MTYPPEGCTYEVRWRLGRRGQGVERFKDEFALGEWFLEMTELGAWDPEEFVEPDFDFENGYQITCATDSQRIGISFRHPRLVMGRINGRRRREAAAGNGAH